LVGSRAAGLNDGLSDWDTVIFASTDGGAAEPLVDLDGVFEVRRPAIQGPPTLDLHRRWRGCAGVDITIVDPQRRRELEREPGPEWAYEMRHARPLQMAATVGEEHRDRIARRFAESRLTFARSAYDDFRQSRNEAVSALARSDGAAQALTAASCVSAASRFCLLAAGEPHPAEKWLLAELDRRRDPAATVARRVLDLSLLPEARFDALWDLWQLVDERVGSELPSTPGGNT